MHTKFERLLSKSLTTLEVMGYYLVVHSGPDEVNSDELPFMYQVLWSAIVCPLPFRLGFVHPLQDVALHQCLPLFFVAFLIQVVPSFLVMSSCHLLLGRPLDLFPLLDRLVGLVVKASTSRAKDPGFESHLRRDFSGLSHTSDSKIGSPTATLPGAWSYRVSTRTGRPGVSIL